MLNLISALATMLVAQCVTMPTNVIPENVGLEPVQPAVGAQILQSAPRALRRISDNGERIPTAEPGPPPERSKKGDIFGKALKLPQGTTHEQVGQEDQHTITGAPVDTVGVLKDVQIPATFPGQVVGLPKGEAPSQVKTNTGQNLPNFAVNGMLWRPGQKEGYQVSPHYEAHTFIESAINGDKDVDKDNPTLMTDDSAKIRVTVISTNPGDRRQAVEDFKKGNGPLAPFRDRILVRSAAPDSWEIKGVGLDSMTEVAAAKPGVVIQEPSGRVVSTITDYTPQKAADALRKANPSFDPAKAQSGPSTCPLGFTHDHWPLVVGATVVAGLLFWTKQQETSRSVEVNP